MLSARKVIRIVVAAVSALVVASPAAAVHRQDHDGRPSAGVAAWAPADDATIHPGVQTVSPSGQCTANFIFTNGADVLIGQAAHCTGRSEATSTNGCEQDPAPHPIGTEVQIQGATRPGTLVYSSWNAMLASGERDEATCSFNDFALVRIDPIDVANVNPSLPAWGARPASAPAPSASRSTRTATRACASASTS